eukprot:TRINITY_DN9410_c0_g1_i1.p1 TRINITY_DN9410_c0_g1~~TRINITY_DN9410_c0_g1_i1.p1  ORF type:complete len:511 (+),score=78.07 TRINITY_DN9410_c0_g1_i1:106-1533(+)
MNQNRPQRYSGDFDLYTQRIAPVKHPPGPTLQQQNFRRAKSTEWDGDILDQNVKNIKNDPFTNFHLGVSSAGNMQTLDKRISASSDQLDCIRKSRTKVDSETKSRFRRSGCVVHAQTKENSDAIANSDVIFKYKGEKYSKNDYFLGNSENLLNNSETSQRERGRKTPFEMFLEDDGPYSRKLYGPVTSEQPEPRQFHKSEKVTMKNIFSKPSEFQAQYCSKSEHDLTKGLSAVKKGILWQQRDKLFSRWKERFFILTDDYFHCFKKGSSKLTEMGEYIFKVKLSSIASVALLDKRGFLTICLSLSTVREGRIYLRRAEGLRDWFNVIKFCVDECKSRKSSWYKNTFKRITKNVTSDISSDGDHEDANDDNAEHAKQPPEHPAAASINKPKGINRLSLVSDLLMSEAISYYTRTKEEKSEDSGIESGNSLENTGSDSQGESSSEHSIQEETNNRDVLAEIGEVPARDKEDLLVCRL